MTVPGKPASNGKPVSPTGRPSSQPSRAAAGDGLPAASASLKAPWERQRGEPKSTYVNFLAYRNLGPARTILAAYQAIKGDKRLSIPGSWAKDSARWNWTSRAASRPADWRLGIDRSYLPRMTVPGKPASPSNTKPVSPTGRPSSQPSPAAGRDGLPAASASLKAPWERQRGEPKSAYVHFLAYRNLGPARTILAAYQAIKGYEKRATPGSWVKDSARWNWTSRAADWDIDQLSRRGEKLVIAFAAALEIVAAKTLAKLSEPDARPANWDAAVELVEMLGLYVTDEVVQKVQQRSRGDARRAGQPPGRGSRAS